MLLELAVGDAYGAGFEYVNPALVARENTLAGYIQHPRHAIAPGCYTDDTQMSLAIAETLVSGRPWTAEVLADAFVQAFKRDPREGYAARFYDFLTEVLDGEEFLARIHAGSDKSGAAMRAAPIGVLQTVEQVLAATTSSAWTPS
jgi:ADP-ribosyl-[dinitrogen reductase] hydrolase